MAYFSLVKEYEILWFSQIYGWITMYMYLLKMGIVYIKDVSLGQAANNLGGTLVESIPSTLPTPRHTWLKSGGRLHKIYVNTSSFRGFCQFSLLHDGQ